MLMRTQALDARPSMDEALSDWSCGDAQSLMSGELPMTMIVSLAKQRVHSDSVLPNSARCAKNHQRAVLLVRHCEVLKSQNQLDEQL